MASKVTVALVSASRRSVHEPQSAILVATIYDSFVDERAEVGLPGNTA